MKNQRKGPTEEAELIKSVITSLIPIAVTHSLPVKNYDKTFGILSSSTVHTCICTTSKSVSLSRIKWKEQETEGNMGFVVYLLYLRVHILYTLLTHRE